MKYTAWRFGSWFYWRSNVERWLFDESPRVVMYHSVGTEGGYDPLTVDEFREQIAWLDRHHHIVDLPTVLDAAPDTGKKVALTFDDGLASFHAHARPILQEYAVPATVFVLGASIEQPESITRARILAERLEVPERFMTSVELQELVADPLVTIGAHTWTHPVLPEITDPDEIDRELIGGRDVLESTLGISIDRFAYPYNEWDDEVRGRVDDAYEYAVQGGGRRTLITEDTDPYLIPRIPPSADLSRFQYDLSDASTYLRGR